MNSADLLRLNDAHDRTCSDRTCDPMTYAAQAVDELAYGDVVPGVTCPECGGELVQTSNGAFCDWDQSFVPIVGSAVLLDEDDEEDETDWTDDDVSDVDR